MQVKKFEAPTIQEALDNVKRELGPEAIILHTKKNSRGFGLLSKASVEVTAAVSDRSMTKKKIVEGRISDSNKDVMRNLPAKKQAEVYERYVDRYVEQADRVEEKVQVNQKSKKITATRYIDIQDDKQNSSRKEAVVAAQVPSPDLSKVALKQGISLEDEIKYLKKTIEELKANQKASGEEDASFAASFFRSGASAQNVLQHTSLDNPVIQEIFESLVVNGVDRKYVLSLIKKAVFELRPEQLSKIDQVIDALATEVMASIEVLPVFEGISTKVKGEGNGPAIFCLIGPTGVGKTTTIAKLASEAIHKKKLRVGLINLDSQRANTFEQLGTYARLLKLPFRSINSIEDIQASLADFHHLDLVIIDTEGRSHRDSQSLSKIQEKLKLLPQSKYFLTLSATTRDVELYDAANRFSGFNPAGVIITKLDEAVVFGGIYNLSRRMKLPFVCFTTGQTIPDDIEDATKERIAALIMDIH